MTSYDGPRDETYDTALLGSHLRGRHRARRKCAVGGIVAFAIDLKDDRKTEADISECFTS